MPLIEKRIEIRNIFLSSFYSIIMLRNINLLTTRTRPILPTRTKTTTSMPTPKDHVRIVEVGPRDGLQNEKQMVPTPTKVQLINRLANEAKLGYIETTSFVSAKKVPQMQDNRAVLDQIQRYPNVTYSALTPNVKGLEAALECNVDQVAVFASASESFSQRNIDCSIAESLARFTNVIQVAKNGNVPVRAYVSCVLGCPYEGHVDPEFVADLAYKLLRMGCHEISLGDTIGIGTPGSMARMLDQVLNKCPADKIAVHCHDTYGQAIANIVVALNKGIRIVDTSVAGLGGCPYAAGASGNVATEDVVYMLNGMGFHTGVQLDKLVEIGTWISNQLRRSNASKVGLALSQKCKL